MSRGIGPFAAGLALSAALAWHQAAAQAAPQSVPAPAALPPGAVAAPPWEQPAASEPSGDTAAPVTSPSPSRKPHGSGARAAASPNLIRGGDTASLIAQLPWWRDGSHPPGSDPGELESPILTACDVWLGFPFASGDAHSLTVRLSAAQHASEIDLVTNKIRVADPAEINEIDLAAPPDQPQDSGRPWLLRGLLALFGGALAAFSAVRYLVA
jgi:hypothetical protein